MLNCHFVLCECSSFVGANARTYIYTKVYVDPSVSTPSRFFTKTFSPANFLAVKVKATVTVASRASGTNPTIIPTAKIRLVIAS